MTTTKFREEKVYLYQGIIKKIKLDDDVTIGAFKMFLHEIEIAYPSPLWKHSFNCEKDSDDNNILECYLYRLETDEQYNKAKEAFDKIQEEDRIKKIQNDEKQEEARYQIYLNLKEYFETKQKH